MADRTTEEAKREAFYAFRKRHINELTGHPPTALDAWNAALQWQAEQQKGEAASNAREVLAAGIVSHYGVPDDKAYECASKVLDLAASPHGVPPGYVLVPVEVVEFLKGAAALDGAWFGERHRTERGTFWWRKRLSSLPQAPQGEQG